MFISLSLGHKRTEREICQMYLCNALHSMFTMIIRANEMSTFTFIAVDSKNFPKWNKLTHGYSTAACYQLLGFSPVEKLASICLNVKLNYIHWTNLLTVLSFFDNFRMVPKENYLVLLFNIHVFIIFRVVQFPKHSFIGKRRTFFFSVARTASAILILLRKFR